MNKPPKLLTKKEFHSIYIPDYNIKEKVLNYKSCPGCLDCYSSGEIRICSGYEMYDYQKCETCN